MLLRDEPTSDDEWYPIWKAHPIGQPGLSRTDSSKIYKAYGFKPEKSAYRAGSRGFVVIVDDTLPVEQQERVRGDGRGRGADLVREWKERERAEAEDRVLTEWAAVARGKRRRLQMQTVRPGQAKFRADLIEAYGGACVITNVSALPTLEAAHIEPHDGDATDVVINGLLLRADLHKLFDDMLLWIDDDQKVRVAESVTDEEYRRWDGWTLRPPNNPAAGPDAVALRVHRRACLLEQASDD
jgi:hypothetical protein